MMNPIYSHMIKYILPDALHQLMAVKVRETGTRCSQVHPGRHKLVKTGTADCSEQRATKVQGVTNNSLLEYY